MAAQDNLLLLYVLALPLAGALLLAFLPKAEAGQHRAVALVTSLATFGLSLFILNDFQVGLAGFQPALGIDLPWIETLGARFHLEIDGISLWLVLLTTFLTPLVVLSTFQSVTERTKEFMIALLFLETAMMGAFLAVDMVLFYVFWEAMLVPMYLIVGVWGGARRRYAAFKLFLYTMVGSLLMLLAIIYLHQSTGTLQYERLLDAEIPLHVERWLFWAFVIAFMVKVPLFPVHTWLPDAHVEAPTAGSAILAGVLLKMGSYGLMRFAFPLFPEAAAVYAPVLAALAVVGIVYGALMAIAQSDAKKLIAYSSVSHMGFIVLGLVVFTPKAAAGAVYQMLNHGVSSGALFLLIGFLYERRHTRLIADFGGIAKRMPVYASLFLFIALSSAGLPGTNGFVGEFLILLGSFTAAAPWAKLATSIAATGVVLGAVYLLWMYRRVFFGPLANSANQALRDLSARELAIILPLAAMALFMGVYPKPFLVRIAPSAEAYTGKILAFAAPRRTAVAEVSTATGDVAESLSPSGAPAYLGPGQVASARMNPEWRGAMKAGGTWTHHPRPTGAGPERPVIKPQLRLDPSLITPRTAPEALRMPKPIPMAPERLIKHFDTARQLRVVPRPQEAQK